MKPQLEKFEALLALAEGKDAWISFGSNWGWSVSFVGTLTFTMKEDHFWYDVTDLKSPSALSVMFQASDIWKMDTYGKDGLAIYLKSDAMIDDDLQKEIDESD